MIVAFNQPVVDFSAASTSVSIEGATVTSVSAHVVHGEPANAYLFTLTPDGAGAITFRLVADQPCADGGICTADGTLLSVSLTVTVTVGSVDHAENGTVTAVTHSGAAPTLAGPDGDRFEIVSGALRFRAPPDFELPEDDGADNTYQVTIGQ